MKLGVVALERGQQIGEITERQLCVKATGDVKFSGALFYGLAGNPQTIVNIMRVSVWLPRRAIKPTKFAICVTNIGWVEVAVHIEIGSSPVLTSPNAIRQLAERRQIVCRKQGKTIIKRKAFAAFNLSCDRSQF